MNDENEITSVDDALEDDRGAALPTPGDDPLPEDNGTPASPPDEEAEGDEVPADHPNLDSNIDSHELYEQGSVT